MLNNVNKWNLTYNFIFKPFFVFIASIFCGCSLANACHLSCVKISIVSQFHVNAWIHCWCDGLHFWDIYVEIVVPYTGLEEDHFSVFRFLFLVSLSLLLPWWSISALALVASVNLVSLNHLCQQMLRIMTGCYNINTALTCRVISLASVTLIL